MKIYVGNLSFQTTEEQIRDIFSPYGATFTVNMINDRETGRFRGFAFIDMSNSNEAQAAIQALNGREIDGRTLKVNEARPQESRPRRDGGGGNRGGGNRSENRGNTRW